ncbi:PepSY domain-containing protein [Microbacterium sp. DT81.1]|uniref:PepSY domain-containing protein n=1 Tax=Microbacterium sp. DT81.1 TaxID=3393413 RepID=UPI003CE9423D
MRTRTIWITSAAAGLALVAGGTAVAFAVTDDLTDDDARESAEITSEEMDAAIAAALDEVGPGTVVDADRDDDTGHAYEIDVVLDAGGRVEVKLDESLNVLDASPEDATDASDDTGSSDDEADDNGGQPVEPADADRASKAALAHTGEGTVTEVERSDDADHVWEVEVTLTDGKDVDVELDAGFAVTKAD